MVTQEGTTITIPAHELTTQGAHSVTMVTADGSDEQVSTSQSPVHLAKMLFECFHHCVHTVAPT